MTKPTEDVEAMKG